MQEKKKKETSNYRKFGAVQNQALGTTSQRRLKTNRLWTQTTRMNTSTRAKVCLAPKILLKKQETQLTSSKSTLASSK